MNIMSEKLRDAGFDVADVEEVVAEKPAYQQVDFNSMTKKEKKRLVSNEVWRLKEKIPYMWEDFAIRIAQYNFSNPKTPISDEFLMRVVEQGEKMDIWGDDANYCCYLQTNNSTTNYKSLVALMGKELASEMNEFGVSWGYYASLYDSIYRKKFGF